MIERDTKIPIKILNTVIEDCTKQIFVPVKAGLLTHDFIYIEKPSRINEDWAAAIFRCCSSGIN